MLSTVWCYCAAVYRLLYIFYPSTLLQNVLFHCIYPKIKLAQINSLHCSDCHLTLIDTVQVRYNIESYFRNLKRRGFLTSRKQLLNSENLHVHYQKNLTLIQSTLLASTSYWCYLLAKLDSICPTFYCGERPRLRSVAIFPQFYTCMEIVNHQNIIVWYIANCYFHETHIITKHVIFGILNEHLCEKFDKLIFHFMILNFYTISVYFLSNSVPN